MKTNPRPFLAQLLLIAALFLPNLQAEQDDFTAIPAQFSNQAVAMKIPAGVRRVRLCTKSQNETWKAHTIVHLKGDEGQLKLRLPDGVTAENCRITVSWSDPFQHQVYQGESDFSNGDDGSTTGIRFPVFLPAPIAVADLPFAVRTTNDAAGFATGATSAVPAEPAPEVEESDIWKWRGRTLYYFNQLRGLQAIDVSDPASPALLDTHPVQWYGDQLYLHPDEEFIMLLSHEGGMSGTGRVDLIAHEPGKELQARTSLPFPGRIVESRLVGEILHVVSQASWESQATDDQGINRIITHRGLVVSKFDLSDPDNPIAAEPLYLEDSRWNYWQAQVQATSSALLLSTTTYNQSERRYISTVHVIDISDPNEAPQISHRYATAGRFLNKFNMHLEGEILTVVSQIEGSGRRASVETFDLSSPKLEAIDSISFAANEKITATRFIGDLVYVVTFLRIDPLFVVDLKDPGNLRVLSELEIPGFSTYLTPLNEDALISVGVEDRRIAVSWFDVSDPTNTSMASRVYVGDEQDRTWSEANSDEKAFGFYPEDNLILVPFQGFVSGQGSTQGVQLIEIGDEELIKRGAFTQPFQARRAKVFGDAVVSVSDRSLRSLDISDPDNPQLLSELTLAWPADRVHRVGDVLIQIENGSDLLLPRLHVSLAANPESILSTITLPSGYVGGSFLQGDCLYLAQIDHLLSPDDDSHQTEFKTTVVNLGSPEDPGVVGSSSFSLGLSGFQNSRPNYQGNLLPDGTLLWYPGRGNGLSHWHGDPWIMPVNGIAITGGLRGWGFPSPITDRIFTVDLSDETQPVVLGTAELAQNNNPWSDRKVRLLDDTLFYGLERNTTTTDESGNYRSVIHQLVGHLDLNNPAQPVAGELVHLPGSFEGVARTSTGGTLIFSSRHLSNHDNGQWHSEMRFQSLAFDGLKVFLQDELVIPDWSYGAKVLKENKLIVQRDGQMFAFGWDEGGQFRNLRSWPHSSLIHEMDLQQGLLVMTGNGVSFADVSNLSQGDPVTLTFPDHDVWSAIDSIEIYDRSSAYLPEGYRGVRTFDFNGTFDRVSHADIRSLPANRGSWESVPLASLLITQANRGMMGAALTDTSDWFFANDETSYEEWARTAFGFAPSVAPPVMHNDSDGDGHSNLWEYLTGSDPADASSCFACEAGFEQRADGQSYLTSTIRLNPFATGDFQIIPEVSFDLVNWSRDASRVEMNEEVDSFRAVISARAFTSVENEQASYFRWTVQPGKEDRLSSSNR